MPAFRVHTSYYMAKTDWVVLTGDIIDGPVRAGMWIDMPKKLLGPGRVPILSVETVQFANDTQKMCVTIEYHNFEKAPFMEISTVEGRILEVTG